MPFCQSDIVEHIHLGHKMEIFCIDEKTFGEGRTQCRWIERGASQYGVYWNKHLRKLD